MKLTGVLILFVIAGILSGCKTNSVNEITATDYKQGTSGLELSLLKNMPPEEVMIGSRFKIAVKFQNKGAYGAGPVLVYINSLNEAWLPLNHNEVELPTINGRSIESPDGGIEIAEFDGNAVAIPPGLESYNAPFFAIVEYGYFTEAKTETCINSDLFGDIKTDSCKPKDKIPLSAQGAPIAVTLIEQGVIPSDNIMDIEFKIKIENKGKGELASDINIDEVLLGLKRLRCDKDFITNDDLKKKRNTIRCRLQESVGMPYTTTLSVALSYTYREQLKSMLTVRRR